MGYGVTETPPRRTFIEKHLEGSEAVFLAASPGTLHSAFDAVHRVNAWRFSPDAPPIAPEVVVIATAYFPAGTVADFREQCCRIVYDMPAAICEELAVIRVERQRLEQRGAALLWAPVAGCLPRVFLIGRNGRQSEMDLNARETRLLRKLASERRSFGQADLGAVVGCRQDQVKVYVERLRAKYERCRQEVGLLMYKNEFITSPGHGLGYSLHARIKNV